MRDLGTCEEQRKQIMGEINPPKKRDLLCCWFSEEKSNGLCRRSLFFSDHNNFNRNLEREREVCEAVSEATEDR